MSARELAKRGTEVRSQRAAIKKAIAAGTIDVAQLLEGGRPDVEPIALSMPVRQLVESIDGIGPEALGATLDGLGPNIWLRVLGSLTIEQRTLLAARVRGLE